MLTGKDKAALRAKAQGIEPSLTVGKGEIDANVLSVIDHALKAHELIKVKVLSSQSQELGDLAGKVNAALASETVLIVGRILILYRENPGKLGKAA